MPVKKVKKKKATKDEVETRLSEIIRMILDGKTNTSIAVYTAQKYNLGMSQVYSNIRDAHKRLEQINCTNIYASYVKVLSINYELLEKAMREADWELALKINQSIAKFTGVETYSTHINLNLNFARLLVENMIKEFQIANESGPSNEERYNKFLLAIDNRLSEIFEQAYPFANQTRQLEPGEPESEPVEKIVDCVL